MLGAALSNVFKDSVNVQLHSFPSPNVKSGSFVYDISLNHKNWKPNREELRTISAEMVKMAAKDLKFERIEVMHDLALEIFKDCPFKREQLPSISRDGSVIIYRIGDHIDISRGPMIGSTALLGRCTIGAVFKIGDINKTDSFYRVQGVALPKDIILNHYAFSILEDRIKEIVSEKLKYYFHFLDKLTIYTHRKLTFVHLKIISFQNPARLPTEVDKNEYGYGKLA